MTDFAVTLLLFIAFIGFSAKRTMSYMHIYQQEEYDSPRFKRWMFKNKVFDKRLSSILFILSLALLPATLLFDVIPVFAANFILFFIFALVAYFEKDPRKKSKKKLVMTERVKRIYAPAVLVSALSGLWCFLLPQAYPLWIINIQLIPFWIMAVNGALAPHEARVQQKFWQEAHDKLVDYRPYVIGITGSFGKTSVKHILGHILKMHGSTLITPGSVNTPMGITRIIREQLEPEHKYFICEMGAYGPGSINRLCQLAPPDMGLITSIGHAHYERFKSLETVAEAKYELAESVLRKDDGVVIVNEQTLRFAHTRQIRDQYRHQFIVCSDAHAPTADGKAPEPSDAMIHSIEQDASGLKINFKWKNITYAITAPIYGLHHGHNIVLAFIAALELRVDEKDIQAALNSLPQIDHRLQVKPQSNGTIVIDDAYNSNPVGFASALDLLNTLARKGRKILITPGMVELGAAHKDAHEKIGIHAGKVCDVVIVIKSERIPSFVEGFKSSGGKHILEVESFGEAQRWVNDNAQRGDVVLIENDLPDLYERVPKF
ncbi:MAG: Mur ligase [Micavibrio sp.]|nr:Mur ligase [Micavibrio sp.]|tara:strand:+ start:32 stop:1669 length:1638 start_codon:yes stop_codon:yes gene_type:complete